MSTDLGSADRRGGPDVLTIGETLVALSAELGPMVTARTLTKSIAGAESNVAIGLARLGVHVAALTRVGDDPFGAEIVRTLRAEGIDTSAVTVDPVRPTGLMVKERTTSVTANVWYHRAGSAASALGPEDVDRAWDLLGPPRHVHVSGVTLALGDRPRAAVARLVARARDAGAGTSFDANHRRRLWSAADFLAAARPVCEAVADLLCSDDEAVLLTGRTDPDEALLEMAGWGPERVVVRHGADGSRGRQRSSSAESGAPCPAVVTRAVTQGPVVDVVGAGDAYTAGYLAEVLTGADLATAMATGAWAAGYVVSGQGDWEHLPQAVAWRARRAGEAMIDR